MKPKFLLPVPEKFADLSFNDVADLSFDDTPDATKTKRSAGDVTGIGFRKTITTRTHRRLFYDLRGVTQAAEMIQKLPRPGDSLHMIMGGDFSAWDFVPAIHKLLHCPIQRLTIATLGFNASNNAHLCEMLDAGTISSAAVIASDYFKNADRATWNRAVENLTRRGQRIVATRNHAKIILIQPAHGRARFCIETSANLRSCNNLEQATLTNDTQLYDFHQKWLNHLLNQSPPN